MAITAEKNMNRDNMKKLKVVSPTKNIVIFMKALAQLYRLDTPFVLSRDIACKRHSLTGF